MPHKQIHEGRNVKRFREMLGLKQDALAFELGEDWHQKRVSVLETKETIELDLLQRIADIMHLPVEAFQNFDEEQAINIISNTFDNGAILNAVNHNPIFHPIDKLVQLHEEKIALYERMLKEKDDMMQQLKQLINK
ncbi:helix-turn-helix transcriptional regulator [Edaphocola flava]|uniref:helix-turn-helix transcriptional regulator n=1 Tax=Edaphocola flava TaxID=2499629 RepID=UPI00100B1000|nr:helix-turn-helix transcriptional regulator [Edaphocola flava]